jgi:hypothetical protein
VAEINIQRKQASAIWWVIGLITLAVILWALFDWGAESEITSTANRPAAMVLAVSSVVPSA